MTTPTGTKPADPLALLRTRRYLVPNPMVIVAVVVAYVVTARLTPPAGQAPAAGSASAPAAKQTSPTPGGAPPA